MTGIQREHARQRDEALEARRARRRHRYRTTERPPLESLDAAARAAPDLPLPTAPPVFEAPGAPGAGDGSVDGPEAILAATRDCVHQAEGRYAAGDDAAALALLAEASDLFAALDDFEAAALAGGAADAGPLDQVLDELLGALDAQRL